MTIKQLIARYKADLAALTSDREGYRGELDALTARMTPQSSLDDLTRTQEELRRVRRADAQAAEKIRSLEADIADMEAAEVDAARAQLPAPASQQPAPADPAKAPVAYDQLGRTPSGGNEGRVYHRGNVVDGFSFLSDVIAAKDDDQRARERLQRHRDEELRARPDVFMRFGSQRDDVGTGALVGLTVPQYALDLVAPKRRARSPLSEVCNQLPLPPTGMEVVISRITTGTTTAAQTAENAAVSETDIDDTELRVPVRTIAGQQDLSRQSIDRLAGTEALVLQDLVNDHDTQLGDQIINGTGANGQHRGIRNVTGIKTATLTDSTPTPAEAIGVFYNLAAQIEDSFYGDSAPMLVMAARRWYWFTSAVGTDLMLMQSRGLGVQAFGRSDRVGYPAGVRGQIGEFDVMVDGNIPKTVSSDQDVVLQVTPEELHLWRAPGGPMFIRAEEVGAATLSVKLVVFSYSAFTGGRYPEAHGVASGTGFAAPSTYGKTVS